MAISHPIGIHWGLILHGLDVEVDNLVIDQIEVKGDESMIHQPININSYRLSNSNQFYYTGDM